MWLMGSQSQQLPDISDTVYEVYFFKLLCVYHNSPGSCYIRMKLWRQIKAHCQLQTVRCFGLIIGPLHCSAAHIGGPATSTVHLRH